MLALVAAALLVVVAVAMTGLKEETEPMRSELLLKVDLEPHEPYSPPSNMYLWWGPSTNHRFVGSGEHIRHLLHMGQIEGGEWRDPMFLGNNGVATFRSQRFRRISETCCSTIVIPPMEWDFPVYNIHKIIGQRIRNFVANGNMLVLTGGILAVEFINSYFFYNIELADGNYSPGPYRRLDDVPVCLKAAPVVLPQKGIAVTAVKKESLPSGTEVLWGTPRSSPVFMIKFCEAQSPNEGMPPVKVLPRDCPAAEADGRPCSCGYVMYIGYNYEEQYPTRWDKVLRAAVEVMSPTFEEPEGGYPEVRKKVIPGTPPCLQKHGAKKSAISEDAAQNLKAEVQGEVKEEAEVKQDGDAPRAAATDSAPEGDVAEQPTAAARGRDGAGKSTRLRTAETKMQLQQQEINSLEAEVDQLRGAMLHKHPVSTAAAGARLVSLAQQGARGGKASMAQLRARAVRLLSEIKARESERARGARGRTGVPARRGQGGEEAILVSSMTQLAQDMHNINGRVNKLTSLVEDKEAHKATSRSHAHVVDMAHPAESHSQASSSEVRHLEKEMGKYKKEARAAKQELRFEQSIPSAPLYENHEPDHTTPLFGSGGRNCGTLCKLKQLVKKTRNNISKELDSALDN
eukprot:Tamp_11235.p1 GENE.Tamp_11235~~Tamp_11235.p1  ORF type:complete len:644 (-),score=180.60 Tamp_11235:10-1896(-)